MTKEVEDLTKSIQEDLSMREELMGRLTSEGFGLKKREISVMTRMSADIVKILDALVELEIFKSRSEAVSAFVEQAISERKKLFDEIKTQAADIRQLRDSAKKHAYEAFQEDAKWKYPVLTRNYTLVFINEEWIIEREKKRGRGFATP